jgi:oligopeptide/dipeptide ABC transporter ATP-binding protein
LLKSVPRLGAHSERLVSIPGAVPNPARFPSGCKFHTRCPLTREAAAKAPEAERVEVATTDERFQVLRKCATVEPVLREVGRGHWAACHLVQGFENSPVTKPELANKREVMAKTVGTVAS